MPNASITVYLSDLDYVRYVEKKVEINKKVQKLVRKEVKEK